MKRLPLLIAVLALVATACGGSADADDGVATLDDATLLDTPDASLAPDVSREEALLAFTACMREAGVDIDDPTVDADGNLRIARPNSGAGAEDGDGGNFRNEEFQAAREQCGELLEGATLGFQDQDRTEIEDQLLEFAACVRDNGYDMPDPDLSNFGTPGQGGGGPFGNIDRDDPAFQDATEACQDILSGFGAGGGRGFGGGPGNGN